MKTFSTRLIPIILMIKDFIESGNLQRRILLRVVTFRGVFRTLINIYDEFFDENSKRIKFNFFSKISFIIDDDRLP